jgi:hypothetical protein
MYKPLFQFKYDPFKSLAGKYINPNYPKIEIRREQYHSPPQYYYPPTNPEIYHKPKKIYWGFFMAIGVLCLGFFAYLHRETILKIFLALKAKYFPNLLTTEQEELHPQQLEKIAQKQLIESKNINNNL